MKTLALIDYGSGNIRSASRALAEAAKLAEIDLQIDITSNPDVIERADCIFLPGVGHYADCMNGLLKREGLHDALTQAVIAKGTPFMGICVGMQLLASIGLEDGDTLGLNWIPGTVKRITPEPSSLAIPHMGWNEIQNLNHPILSDLGENPHLYFTHSYVFETDDSQQSVAHFNYGGDFTAAVARNNIFGTQFHPEKSQKIGQKLLANFLKWKP
ncbi:imidazole glycerol phosphate synthase subunit HisH [Hirschia maritima]|uniref:imidazole glycerol phosphate synthase subunit HisH n=1 Tax=Hirschia maritima TaxID=1121961 RepID=UPI000369C754|nr:imidazole glycerol phosphate synthase subunit HisH [Hirschia maritima]